jgi:hypothetical protein
VRENMRQFEGKEVIVDVEKSCTCNRCGKTYQFGEAKYQDVVNVDAQFVDYGTTYENQKWNFDVCANCLVEWFKSFKHVPSGFMEDYTEVSNVKNKQATFEKWKETGEWDEFLGYSYDELVALVNRGYAVDYVNELIQKYYSDRELIN